MLTLFLALTAFNLIALAVTTALGYGVSAGRPWGTYHQLFGALATILCCAVHCAVFTYFMATAKWVQHAVTVKHLEQALTEPTRSFKMQAFPAALLAMATTCLAAFIGAATFGYQFSATYHHVAAWVALLTNVVVVPIEYRAIARNGRLIDGILARVTPADAGNATMNPQAPVAERQTLRT